MAIQLPTCLDLEEMISKLPRFTKAGEPLEVRLLVWKDPYVEGRYSGLFAWGDTSNDPADLTVVLCPYGDNYPYQMACYLLSKVDELVDQAQLAARS